MSILRRLPAAFSLLLLGAHFLHAGQPWLVPVCLALLAPLFIRRSWAQWTVAAALALGTLAWIWTLVQDVQLRLAVEEPWHRLAIILGAVALFTAWSAWILRREARPRI